MSNKSREIQVARCVFRKLNFKRVLVGNRPLALTNPPPLIIVVSGPGLAAAQFYKPVRNRKPWRTEPGSIRKAKEIF